VIAPTITAIMSIASPAYGEKDEAMTVTTTNAIKINVNIVRPYGAFRGPGSVIVSPVSFVSV
jgi:hypothetical protein